MTKEQDSELLWQRHRQHLLNKDAEYREAVDHYKMKTGADWLLFAIPVVAGIVSMSYIPIERELLRWLASIGITVVVFVICVFVKSLTIPGRPLSEIEADVKRRYIESLKHKPTDKQ